MVVGCRGELHGKRVSIITSGKENMIEWSGPLTGLNAALAAFAGAYTKPKRRKMSAKSRAKIAAAQRARWAKFRAKKKQ